MTDGSKKITIQRARQLDRAMTALHQGRITYGRWVEVLRMWVAGDDVAALELGCENTPERIMLRYHGQIVSASDVANGLGLASVNSAAVALHRMARQKNQRARFVARGRFKITGFLAGSAVKR